MRYRERTLGRQRGLSRHAPLALACAVLLLAACQQSGNTDYVVGGNSQQNSGLQQKHATEPVGERRGYIRGASGDLKTGRAQVNGYLWRAALDTVSFMPLSSVDATGGAIVTDWYTPPETPDDRFKVTILVRGEDLRSDGVKATVFRQNRDEKGGWVDAKIDENTQVDLENIILSQARLLRNEAMNRPQ